jgi:hypothetical protein
MEQLIGTLISSSKSDAEKKLLFERVISNPKLQPQSLPATQKWIGIAQSLVMDPSNPLRPVFGRIMLTHVAKTLPQYSRHILSVRALAAFVPSTFDSEVCLFVHLSRTHRSFCVLFILCSRVIQFRNH